MGPFGLHILHWLVTTLIDFVDFYSRMLGIAPYRRADKVAGPRIEEVTNLDKAKIRAAWFNVGKHGS